MSRRQGEKGRYGDDVSAALRELSRFGKVLHPLDADPPILAPSVGTALREWMAELNYKQELAAVGLKPRSTGLLYGPPGTGKTTYAHQLAARLGLPMLSVQSESLISKYVGETGNNMGKLFDLLDSVAGQIVVLFDEFDAIAPHRSGEQASDKERAGYLAVMLRRIEGYEGLALAATNKRENIDSAMWRRFDLQVEMALPEVERYQIIQRYVAPYELEERDCDLLVDITEGASPALLRQLMEGVKRTLVLGPTLQRKIDDPVEVFRQIISAISPPPEMPRPALWDNKKELAALAQLKPRWPLTIKQAS